MKKYVIKVVCEATDKNDKFKGETQVYYKAKYATEENADNLKWFAKLYGYSTKAAAAKGLEREKRTAKWESEKGFWKDSVELLEIEIDE